MVFSIRLFHNPFQNTFHHKIHAMSFNSTIIRNKFPFYSIFQMPCSSLRVESSWSSTWAVESKSRRWPTPPWRSRTPCQLTGSGSRSSVVLPFSHRTLSYRSGCCRQPFHSRRKFVPSRTSTRLTSPDASNMLFKRGISDVIIALVVPCRDSPNLCQLISTRPVLVLH